MQIAAGALIGGGIGLVGQGLQDVLSGNFSGYEVYAGAAAGGATFGAITAATGGLSLIGCGVVGVGSGAVQSSVQQGLSVANERQESFSGTQLVGNSLLNGFFSAIPGLKIAPVTLGKGSYSSIEKQIYTKLQNSTISVGGIQPSTYGKIIVSNVAQQGPSTVSQSVFGVISQQLSQISATLSNIINGLNFNQEKKK